MQGGIPSTLSVGGVSRLLDRRAEPVARSATKDGVAGAPKLFPECVVDVFSGDDVLPWDDDLVALGDEFAARGIVKVEVPRSPREACALGHQGNDL